MTKRVIKKCLNCRYFVSIFGIKNRRMKCHITREFVGRDCVCDNWKPLKKEKGK